MKIQESIRTLQSYHYWRMLRDVNHRDKLLSRDDFDDMARMYQFDDFDHTWHMYLLAFDSKKKYITADDL